ncbi:MAG: hypothetical protein HKN82_09165 [Akkermansiaceae bacterium]|nr:hypothetical protein [Akkermansiaceae bacterium]NNM29670.1 hypothetical protein [Akkermansiaceae bacterium]
MRNLLAPLVLLAPGLLLAGEPKAASPSATPEFKAPVRLMAGEKFLGEGRYYPSPVFRDMNGDGKLDVVVGDLRGHLTIALRTGRAMEFAAETDLLGDDGKALDFSNW